MQNESNLVKSPQHTAQSSCGEEGGFSSSFYSMIGTGSRPTTKIYRTTRIKTRMERRRWREWSQWPSILYCSFEAFLRRAALSGASRLENLRVHWCFLAWLCFWICAHLCVLLKLFNFQANKLMLCYVKRTAMVLGYSSCSPHACVCFAAPGTCSLLELATFFQNIMYLIF